MALIFFGLFTSILAILLSKVKSEYAGLCVLCGAVVLLLSALKQAEGVFSLVNEITQKTEISGKYLSIVFKGIGICIITEFSSSVANDHHHSSLAKSMELLCRIELLLLSAPIFQDVVEMLEGLLT